VEEISGSGDGEEGFLDWQEESCLSAGREGDGGLVWDGEGCEEDGWGGEEAERACKAARYA